MANHQDDIPFPLFKLKFEGEHLHRTVNYRFLKVPLTGPSITTPPVESREERRIRREERWAEQNEEDRTEFSESPKGEKARHEWAEGYDDLNGAPEGPDDY